MAIFENTCTIWKNVITKKHPSKIFFLVLDPLPGLLFLWGAGRHRGLAVSGPSHPPPHTRTKPLLGLEGDTDARMTSDLNSVPPDQTVLLPLHWLQEQVSDQCHSNTGSFLFPASSQSWWLSSEPWKSFMPEYEEKSQPINGCRTDCSDSEAGLNNDLTHLNPLTIITVLHFYFCR